MCLPPPGLDRSQSLFYFLPQEKILTVRLARLVETLACQSVPVSLASCNPKTRLMQSEMQAHEHGDNFESACKAVFIAFTTAEKFADSLQATEPSSGKTLKIIPF